MTSTIETLLFDLKHYKSFITPPTDPSNPYTHSMHTFQTFTSSLIHTLEAAQPAILALHDLYTDLPSFHNQAAFQAWVKDATLKHPQRRTAKQHQYLHIVALQSQQNPGMSVADIVISAISAVQEWRDQTFDPDNLKKDPDAFYFFTATSRCGFKTLPCDISSRHGNKTNTTENQNRNKFPSEGPICTNTFNPVTYIPQQAPCGHIFCAPCLRTWLHQCSNKTTASSTYTCPLCRACLVCSRDPCMYHELPKESVAPMPLGEILDAVLPGKVGEVLHGFTAKAYWGLRERTRRDRVVVAGARKGLGLGVLQGGGGDAARDVLGGVEGEAAEKIRAVIVGAVVDEGIVL